MNLAHRWRRGEKLRRVDPGNGQSELWLGEESGEAKHPWARLQSPKGSLLKQHLNYNIKMWQEGEKGTGLGNRVGSQVQPAFLGDAPSYRALDMWI